MACCSPEQFLLTLPHSAHGALEFGAFPAYSSYFDTGIRLFDAALQWLHSAQRVSNLKGPEHLRLLRGNHSVPGMSLW